MATLQDIADRVGVSTVTVSKVLRGKVKGSWARSAERVQQIHKVAEELGYQVDWRARALKTRRTHMIGLLNTDRPETRLHDPRLLSGLIETLGNAGYSAVFYRVPGKRTHASFADTRFDGVIIDYHIEPEEIALIEQANLPAVIVNAPSASGIPSVMPDHILAGALAARHLIDKGHRRIGYVQSMVRESKLYPRHMIKMWREGIRHEMARAGVADDYIDVVPNDDMYDNGPAAFVPQLRELLSRPDRPTALIVNQPGRSIELVLQPLEAMGLRCPEDLSVISMGADPALRWFKPSVTCVEIPFYQLGQVAARTLLERIDPGSVQNIGETPIELPVNLIARDSTGRVPKQVKLTS